MAENHPQLREQVVSRKEGLLGEYDTLDQAKLAALDEPQQSEVKQAVVKAQQATLAKIAVLPAIMCVCYLILIFYFKSKGGYEAEVLASHGADDEECTGDIERPADP